MDITISDKELETSLNLLLKDHNMISKKKLSMNDIVTFALKRYVNWEDILDDLTED